MDAVTCSAARANLAQTIDRVCGNYETLINARNGEDPSMVMLSVDDDKALE